MFVPSSANSPGAAAASAVGAPTAAVFLAQSPPPAEMPVPTCLHACLKVDKGFAGFKAARFYHRRCFIIGNFLKHLNRVLLSKTLIWAQIRRSLKAYVSYITQPAHRTSSYT
eukprot:1161724-Pelagomonas_calceolata.AAC.14